MAVKVNTEAVTQSAQRIRTANRQLLEAYAQVDAAVAQLSRQWQGTAGDEAVASLRGVRNRHVDERYTSVEKLTQFLEESVAQKYQETEQRRVRAAAEFR